MEREIAKTHMHMFELQLLPFVQQFNCTSTWDKCNFWSTRLTHSHGHAVRPSVHTHFSKSSKTKNGLTLWSVCFVRTYGRTHSPEIMNHFSSLCLGVDQQCSLLARLRVWPSGSLMTPVSFLHYFLPPEFFSFCLRDFASEMFLRHGKKRKFSRTKKKKSICTKLRKSFDNSFFLYFIEAFFN